MDTNFVGREGRYDFIFFKYVYRKFLKISIG